MLLFSTDSKNYVDDTADQLLVIIFLRSAEKEGHAM